VTFTGKLYAFQEEAVERMVEARHLLVAYEMGLGKTVIAIAAIEHLIDQEEIAAGFIICPASIKTQWARFITEFTAGEANVIVVSGDADTRDRQYRSYLNGGAEYLIMNPEQLVGDWDLIAKLPRDYIVADEIQWAKNFKPKRSKRLKRLRAEYRWGLTGQPVENRAEEAFSIFEWIDPTVLGNFRTFDAAFIKRDRYGRVRVYKNLPTLHRMLSEHMVRRTREEVKDQLPAVTEENLYVELDVESARLYRRIVADLDSDVEEAFNTWGNFSLSALYAGQEQGEVRGRIMSKLTTLRQLCDHPDLIRHSDGEYAAELIEAGRLERCKQNPKLDVAVDLICSILEANPRNKIVLFSFFKRMLTLIADATQGATRSVLFTGDVNQDGRDRAKQAFARDPETRLFLSSDAGGVGLDLPMANYLISYDLPWSAGAYAQRQSRIIRLSSVFPEVTLLSLQVAGSIEEYQQQLLVQKAKVAAAVVDGRGISPKGRLTLDLDSLTTFLREHDV
jgi:SNF2 family DNA or RNA helicase